MAEFSFFYKWCMALPPDCRAGHGSSSSLHPAGFHPLRGRTQEVHAESRAWISCAQRASGRRGRKKHITSEKPHPGAGARFSPFRCLTPEAAVVRREQGRFRLAKPIGFLFFEGASLPPAPEIARVRCAASRPCQFRATVVRLCHQKTKKSTMVRAERMDST